MKIKICSNGPINRGEVLTTLNPSFLFLKTYYDLYGLTPDVTWQMSDLIAFDDADVAAENILKDPPDILGMGLYTWNYRLQLAIAKKVKEARPETLVVLGGPQLSAHRNDDNDPDNQENFFKTYPFADYVVYGDGEKPFQQIIDYHSGALTDKKDFVNIVDRDSDSNRIIYPFEMMADSTYMDTSAWLTNKEYLKAHIDDVDSKGLKKANQLWAVEFARGCMYSCSYCDWSQNLTKKVKRRNSDWKSEIDLFHELDIAIRETDANFGQWATDIEIFDYALSKFDPKRNFRFQVHNSPKLKKDVTEYFMLKMLQTFDSRQLKFSLQDTSEDVLSAINRPSVSWEKIVSMVGRWRRELPPERFKRIGAEIILGLPAQTFNHILENCIKLYSIGIWDIRLYNWIILANSPANDQKYLKMWGIKLRKQYVNQSSVPEYQHTVKFNSLADAYQDIVSSDKYIAHYTQYVAVYETKHISLAEMAASHMLVKKYRKLAEFLDQNGKTYTEDQMRKALTKIGNDVLSIAKKQIAEHQPHIDKFDYIVWGTWDSKNNLLYSDIEFNVIPD